MSETAVIDCFAGGGGASTGIEAAIGRPCDIAVNHDPKAIAMHRANHPKTHHVTEDIFDADLRHLVGDRPVELMWASPDCTHHSRAKGGKPRENGLRMLPWAVHKHAKDLMPDVICMENVAEIQNWGPLDDEGRIIKERAGEEYRRFVDAMGCLGYEFDCRELVASDFGAPTSRKRWYAVLRRDGLPIRWPEPTHGDGMFGLPPVPASSCIDFTNVGTSIFDRKRPLADATCRRIARGLRKFVIEDPSPFIVPIGYGERPGQKPRIASIHEPLPTIVAGGTKHYLCTPFLTRFNQNALGQRVDSPLQTIMTGGAGPFGMVTPFLTKFYNTTTGQRCDAPLSTITATGQHIGLVTPWLMKYYGGVTGQRVDTPMGTITAGFGGHFALVSAFLVKYYGTSDGQSLNSPLSTITTRDRFGLVSVVIDGETYVISDIYLRMLTPEELKRAQAQVDCRARHRETIEKAERKRCVMKSGKQKRAALRSRSSKISGGEGSNRTSQVRAVHHAQSSFHNGLPPLEPVTIPAIMSN